MNIKLLSLASVSPLIASQAMAHPGDHSTGGVMTAIWHQLTEPDHLLFAGLVAAAVIVGVKVYQKKKA
ncbi:HupE/UreJ family protein [Endozoicomonas sp. GU-1]|uniref:HupE/UreJ family protein n=1 Tax=Endozoicomonas sp. GU-1 TaxID=3009078 RepID=UPI0022B38D8E|nr:HupE/UreJ family protein [Endozoicomonas sp. GU-1]WBA81933.1 HupE/UreJ family protein [Endozoicomonas sp. GU-1]WBA84884.1 HupE/UreJ family protein [Endozoicomonas sp. GU-1]